MMKNLFKWLGIGLFGAMMVFALAGCAGEEGSAPVKEETKAPYTEEKTGSLKIGGIFPLTGDGATYGEPMQKVVKIAMDEINAAGGVKGQKLEIIWENGKCNGNDAAAAANNSLILIK